MGQGEFALQVEALAFNYGQRQALKDLSFRLPAGRFVGLVGPNGAGKTTLFALLTRLLLPAQGDIRFFGEPLNDAPGRALAQSGVVFQLSTLDLDLTVGQNLRYHAALHGIGTRQANIAIAEQLERFNMAERLNDKVRELNQGHRRRVEFARALLHQPRLLLLDEATVGLDIDTRDTINSHVRELCSTQGVTALWASHQIDDFRADDDILLLKQGELIGEGKAADVARTFNCDDLYAVMRQITPKAA